MDTATFEGEVQDLRAKILGAMEAHFQERELTFDIMRFLLQTETDIDQFTREAFFLGAEVFPTDDLPRS